MMKFTKQLSILIFYFILIQSVVSAQIKINNAFNWSIDQYQNMSTDERIGQLFMVSAYSGGPNANDAQITELINKYKIGGLIFMQGSVNSQANLTNKYQNISKTPLLIAMDAEWGIGMRMKEVTNIAKNIQIGATQDSMLAFRVGEVIARQCQRLGVHINFGPDVDINNNPDNPVINFRSFGENKYIVSALGIAYALGMQHLSVLACAKHFPGHGDTDVDSHKDLPAINKPYSILWDNELFPFRELSAAGVQSMMIAHLTAPALTNSQTLPTTLSYECVTNLLKKKMNYKGLIFTDALNMQGVAKYYSPGEVDYKAFLAGNDVLLFSQSVPKAIAMIRKGLEDGTITEERLKQSVVKILMAKYMTNAYNFKNVSTQNLTEDLNKEIYDLNKDIAEESITLVRDDQNIVLNSKNQRILYIALGKMSVSSADLGGISGVTIKQVSPSTSPTTLRSYLQTWSSYDKVIIGIHGINKYPAGNYGLSQSLISTAKYFMKNCSKSILLINGNPYAIKYFCDAPTIMVNYEETPINFATSLRIIKGQLRPKGKLPVSPCSNIREGQGIVSLRNQYNSDSLNMKNSDTKLANWESNNPSGNPIEETNSNSTFQKKKYDFSKLDQIANSSISTGVFPGCQILVSKDGEIVYNQSFGAHIYGGMKVKNNDVYDIASITKIAATTLAVMQLYDKGKISLTKNLSDYLDWTLNTNKAYLVISDILMHQAGLKSWIPFYKSTLDSSGAYLPGIYSKLRSPAFSIAVANLLFINTQYPQTIWDDILASPVGSHRYEYSDLDFLFLQKVVEKVSGQNLNDYVEKHFYEPMMLSHIGYNPIVNRWAQLKDIVPTEIDNYFRQQLIHGYVHDPAAAMLGGVAGHAGIFSNAECIYRLMQMLLNGGIYEGKRYINTETVHKFTSYQNSTSRRGLGFDKPAQGGGSSPTGKRCAKTTFGHQGFTGTCVWADPTNNVVFVFLSNRVYPSADNSLINKLDVRTHLQDEAYKAMGI